MYGLSFYSQGLSSQAAQQFGLAITVYKKHGFDTAEIVKWQNELKALKPTTNSQSTILRSSSTMVNTIQDHRAKAVAAGHTILGSGVYNAIETLEFNVKRGETYIVVAMIEGYSPFVFDLFSSPGSEFLKPTHKWEDSAYSIESSANYAMRSQVIKAKDHSMLQVNFMITSRSQIQKIRFFPNKEKGKPLHWIFYKLK